MKRTKVGSVILGVVAALALMAAPVIAAQEQPDQPAEKAEKGQPFSGKVGAVDLTAKTLKVGDTLIYVADTTKITKDGKEIKLAEIKSGEEVHGTKRMTFDGKSEALTVKVGPMAKDAPGTETPR